MNFTFRQIRYFVATAEHGQVSQAAGELGISQSAITTAIKELEQIVGVELFTRSTQGMDMTPAGRQFLFHAYEILNKVEEATSLLLPANDFAGRLTVAATYTVIGYFLPNHLGRLRRAWPNLDIQLFELNREAIEDGLLANRYDMAVLLTSNVINPDLTTETLMSSRRRLWVPAGRASLCSPCRRTASTRPRAYPWRIRPSPARTRRADASSPITLPGPTLECRTISPRSTSTRTDRCSAALAASHSAARAASSGPGPKSTNRTGIFSRPCRRECCPR